MKKTLLISLFIFFMLFITSCKTDIVSDVVTKEEWYEILSTDYQNYTISIESKSNYDGKTQLDERTTYFIDDMQFSMMETAYAGRVINYVLRYKNCSFSHFISDTIKNNQAYFYYSTSVHKRDTGGFFSEYADQYDNFTYDSSEKGYKMVSENGDIFVLKFKDKRVVEMRKKNEYYDSVASIINYGTTEVEKPINYFIEDDSLFEIIDKKYYFLASFKEAENITLPKTIRGENYSIKYLAVLENTKTITIPETLISIDSDAVLDACKFEEIHFVGTEEEWNTILSNTSLSSTDFFRLVDYKKNPVEIKFTNNESIN